MSRFLIIFLLFFYISCEFEEKKNKQIPEFRNLISLKSESVLEILKHYRLQNLPENKGLVLVDIFAAGGDTVVMNIYSRISIITMDNVIPSYYILVDDIPVLFYTGVEKIVSFDSTYRNHIEKIITPFVESFTEDEDNDVLQLPPSYNPKVWKIEIVNSEVVNINK